MIGNQYRGVRHMNYKNKEHEDDYNELVEQMYLSEEERKNPNGLLRRQLAFCYLIALYQEDYERYEGHKFYIELGEELSLDGPTYLLEDGIGERRYKHEQILPLACQILQGEEAVIPTSMEDDRKWIEEALKLSY